MQRDQVRLEKERRGGLDLTKEELERSRAVASELERRRRGNFPLSIPNADD